MIKNHLLYKKRNAQETMPMANKNSQDVGWLFGKLYICENNEQLQKVADIGNICRNTKYKTFYHNFLFQKYEKIKDIADYEREPFTKFERDIGKYAHEQYIRSNMGSNKEKQDPSLLEFIKNLAQNQYHS